ncbi:MAG: hypothetical protein VX951_09255 [Planctomycetota bacterium]|nr:hypothetical protein [Planctomycetota bacterium]
MENGLFSSEEFAQFAKQQTMFLHVTSRVEGRKQDSLLREIGGRGFPTIVVMNEDGEILARPSQRSVVGFKAAVAKAAVARVQMIESKRRDPVGASAQEFLRKLEIGTLVDPVANRAMYLKCRGAMTQAQRDKAEKGLVSIELQAALSTAISAKPGVERDRAILAMFACKTKLGGKWPWNPGLNRVLLVIMGWAEEKGDPQLFESLLPDFIRLRKEFYARFRSNDAFIEKQKARLADLWQGKPPPPPNPRRRGGAQRRRK